jgi:hypothetical protein
MTRFETRYGSRLVISTSNDEFGPWRSTLYVNGGETITMIRGRHDTRKGAEQWARRTLGLPPLMSQAARMRYVDKLRESGSIAPST